MGRMVDHRRHADAGVDDRAAARNAACALSRRLLHRGGHISGDRRGVDLDVGRTGIARRSPGTGHRPHCPGCSPVLGPGPDRGDHHDDRAGDVAGVARAGRVALVAGHTGRGGLHRAGHRDHHHFWLARLHPAWRADEHGTGRRSYPGLAAGLCVLGRAAWIHAKCRPIGLFQLMGRRPTGRASCIGRSDCEKIRCDAGARVGLCPALIHTDALHRGNVMAYDLLIKNGTVVDGTGAPRRRADVAIAGGLIAEVGKVAGGAARVIDASDLIVAPGFIDHHTHYDAQICWDPLVSCSSWHGVTTVLMGNCGVGIAPCKPDVREVAAWDLVNVEAIPFDVLQKGVTWDWVTFPEFMDAASRRRSGINLGFMAPLTPFRHFVMGAESMERAATPQETSQIAALLREAVGAGAWGFTTTVLAQHIGYQGHPLACRLASRDELAAYGHALRDLGKGAIEVALTRRAGRVADDEYELLDFLLTHSGRPVTFLAMSVSPKRPEGAGETLRRLEPLLKRGAMPQITCRPFVVQIDLRNPFSFADMEAWNRVFNQPAEVQKQIYAAPAFRQAFREELKKPHLFNGKSHRVEILEVSNPAMKGLERKTVAEVAEERGATPWTRSSIWRWR